MIVAGHIASNIEKNCFRVSGKNNNSSERERE